MLEATRKVLESGQNAAKASGEGAAAVEARLLSPAGKVFGKTFEGRLVPNVAFLEKVFGKRPECRKSLRQRRKVLASRMPEKSLARALRDI